MLRIFFSIALIAVATVSKAQNDTLINRKLSLAECIESALKTNAEVRKRNLQTQAQRISYLQSKAELLPTISGGYSHGMNFGRNIDRYTNSFINQENTFANGGLNSSLTLFNGFALFNSIRRSSLNYKATQLEEQQSKDELTLSVILAYWNVLTNQDVLLQTADNKEVIAKRLAQTELLNKEGAIEPRVYYDLKAANSRNQVDYVNAVGDLENAKLALSQLMNIPYTKALSVEPISAETELNAINVTARQIYEDALKSLAEVRAADLRTQTAETDIRIRRANYYPSISLNGGLGSNYSSTALQDVFLNSVDAETDNFVDIAGTRYTVKAPRSNFASEKISFSDQLKNNRSSNFSVGLNIPILGGFRTRSNVAVAKLTKKAVEIDAENVKISLQQLTEQAYYNMNFSKDRFLALTEQVNSLAESFRTEEVKFNAGVINSVDYLIAKNSLDNARLDSIRSRYDFILRKQIVEYYRGNRSF